MESNEKHQLPFEPIGYIRTEMPLKFFTPHQPSGSDIRESRIELSPGRNFEQALHDLASFDRIWLIWWFHKNANWKPKVMPPRGPAIRRGVFATRSPHRPNPIGLTCVPLLKVVKRTLIIGTNDLLDGTPILDIKPYLAQYDAFPDAKNGWLAEVASHYACAARYQVIPSPQVAGQLQWLKDAFGVDFFSRAKELLEFDPTPHRTRRIVQLKDGSRRIGCGAWRMRFTVSALVVEIMEISPGYPERVLKNSLYEAVQDRDAQLAFLARM